MYSFVTHAARRVQALLQPGPRVSTTAWHCNSEQELGNSAFISHNTFLQRPSYLVLEYCGTLTVCTELVDLLLGAVGHPKSETDAVDERWYPIYRPKERGPQF
jgi:hypothetical protein